jgi:plasmid stabilization system protein ParE
VKGLPPQYHIRFTRDAASQLQEIFAFIEKDSV